MSARPIVVVTRRLPEPVHQALAREFDARLNPEDRPLTAADLREALQHADAVLTTVTDNVTSDVLAVDPRRARLIANFGVGFNNIDIEAAKTRGIAVSNTPDVLTDATADLAITLLLMVARRTGEGERHLRGGQWTGWRPTHMLGTQVAGKTLGLVGMGRIARAVAQRAHHGFGMRVIFHDPFPPSAEIAASLGAEPRATLEEVLREADFVSLHCPATPETRHLMNRDRLALMRPEAFLINTARGDVVDEAALVEALDGEADRRRGARRLRAGAAGHAGAAHDGQRRAAPAPRQRHQETRVAMGMRAFENLQLFLAAGRSGTASCDPGGAGAVRPRPSCPNRPTRWRQVRPTTPTKSSSCSAGLMLSSSASGRPRSSRCCAASAPPPSSAPSCSPARSRCRASGSSS